MGARDSESKQQQHAVPVNGNSSNANVVCWNGTSEVTAASTSASACNSLTPIANPVYLVTALAVTPSGARRVVQEEIAQTPKGGLPGGLFATGMGCSALESCRQCKHWQLQLRHRGYSHESTQQSDKLRAEAWDQTEMSVSAAPAPA